MRRIMPVPRRAEGAGSAPGGGAPMSVDPLALYGPDAVARLARGFIVGLGGFTAFFFVVAAAVVPLGVAVAFIAALAAALATVFAATRVLRTAQSG